MDLNEIDLRALKSAVDAVFNHLINDLRLEKVAIAEKEDFYWDFFPLEVHDTSNKPPDFGTGRLKDDLDLLKNTPTGAVALDLIHVAPLLRYIGLKIKQ